MTSPYKKRGSIELVAEVMKATANGETMGLIARRTKVSPARVKRILLKEASKNQSIEDNSTLTQGSKSILSVIKKDGVPLKVSSNPITEEEYKARTTPHQKRGLASNFDLSYDEVKEYQAGRSAHSISIERGSTSSIVIRKLKQLGIRIRTLAESRQISKDIQTEKGILDPDPLPGDVYGIWKVEAFGLEKRNGKQLAFCISICCNSQGKKSKDELTKFRDNGSSHCKFCLGTKSNNSDTWEIFKILPSRALIAEESFKLQESDLEAYRQGESISLIAERNNVSSSVIKEVIHPKPAKPIKGYQLTETDILSYQEGKSMRSIGKKAGVSPQIIKRLLIKGGFKIRTDGYITEPGQRNIAPIVLSPEDIKSYETGISAHAIGKQKGFEAKYVLDKLRELGIETRTLAEVQDLTKRKNLEKGICPDPIPGDIFGIWRVIEFGAIRTSHGVKMATCIAKCCKVESNRTKKQLSVIKDNGSIYCRNCKRDNK
jgi:transposase